MRMHNLLLPIFTITTNTNHILPSHCRRSVVWLLLRWFLELLGVMSLTSIWLITNFKCTTVLKSNHRTDLLVTFLWSILLLSALKSFIGQIYYLFNHQILCASLSLILFSLFIQSSNSSCVNLYLINYVLLEDFLRCQIIQSNQAKSQQ